MSLPGRGKKAFLSPSVTPFRSASCGVFQSWFDLTGKAVFIWLKLATFEGRIEWRVNVDKDPICKAFFGRPQIWTFVRPSFALFLKSCMASDSADRYSFNDLSLVCKTIQAGKSCEKDEGGSDCAPFYFLPFVPRFVCLFYSSQI